MNLGSRRRPAARQASHASAGSAMIPFTRAQTASAPAAPPSHHRPVRKPNTAVTIAARNVLSE